MIQRPKEPSSNRGIESSAPEWTVRRDQREEDDPYSLIGSLLATVSSAGVGVVGWSSILNLLAIEELCNKRERLLGKTDELGSTSKSFMISRLCAPHC